VHGRTRELLEDIRSALGLPVNALKNRSENAVFMACEARVATSTMRQRRTREAEGSAAVSSIRLLSGAMA
jgi:hypothetical protein